MKRINLQTFEADLYDIHWELTGMGANLALRNDVMDIITKVLPQLIETREKAGLVS